MVGTRSGLASSTVLPEFIVHKGRIMRCMVVDQLYWVCAGFACADEGLGRARGSLSLYLWDFTKGLSACHSCSTVHRLPQEREAFSMNTIEEI